MAHFAELDENNVIKQVIVVHNNELLDNGIESETKGITFCQSLFGGNWVQTSRNSFGGIHYLNEVDENGNKIPSGKSHFRFNYAGIGYSYDPIRDAFIPPKPTEGNWILNEDTCLWEEVTE